MRVSFCVLFIFIQLNTFAQQWLGISSSNYAGTYSIYANPANVVDSRYKFFINLAGANADITNNYASWGAPYSIIGLMTNTVSSANRASNGRVLYRNTYTEEAVNNKNSTAFFGTDVRGPSLMFNLEKAKMAIGLTTRMRVITNLNNTTASIASSFVNGTIRPSIYDIPQDNNHFSANLNGYAEMGITVGKIIREQEEHFLKVGLTAKRVNALLNVHYIIEDIDFTIKPVPAQPRRQIVDIANASGTFGLTNSAAMNIAGFSPKWLFGNAPAGYGYGLDIGFVYEYQPEYRKYKVKLKDGWTTDGTKNKYLYRFSMALVDFGRMSFKGDNLVYQTNAVNINTVIQPGTFNKIRTPDQLMEQMNTAFNWTDADYTHAFKVPLPTVISTSFDYAFSEKLYVNATWIQNVRETKGIGMNQPSLIAIIPRWESRWFEVSMPLSLQNGYRNLSMGLAGRAGPLFVGTDNLPGVLNIGKPRGINAYFGLFIPIYRTLPDSPNPCYEERRPRWGQGIRDAMKKRKQRRQWNRIR